MSQLYMLLKSSDLTIISCFLVLEIVLKLSLEAVSLQGSNTGKENTRMHTEKCIIIAWSAQNKQFNARNIHRAHYFGTVIGDIIYILVNCLQTMKKLYHIGMEVLPEDHK